MASLSTILSNKKLPFTPATESNFLPGQQFIFIASHQNCGINQFTWTAPSNGTVTIEIWGASGSTGRMCCCGTGIPGNSGAYSRKTIPVTTGNTVCGTVGRPCYNLTMCYPGRSENTCICYVANTNGTMCAEGGFGGYSFCLSASSSVYCCLVLCGFCFTNCGSVGCGWICNFGGPNSVVAAVATGGDVNCPGGISCTCFAHCNACCYCVQYPVVTSSAGVFTKEHTRLSINQSYSGLGLNQQGESWSQYLMSLNAAGHPITGVPFTSCSSNYQCACYEITKCQILLPYGFPAIGPTVCQEVRHNGMRGGPGAVRIEFIGS